MDGTLSIEQEANLIRESTALITRGRATIPDHILDPLFCFMRYTILGALHLNKLAVGSQLNLIIRQETDSSTLNRKRIVCRLSLGFTAEKKRLFLLSRLKDALGGLNITIIEQQIALLESHVIVTCPTRRSVELSRGFSVNAKIYLKNSCGFSNTDIVELLQNITLLID